MKGYMHMETWYRNGLDLLLSEARVKYLVVNLVSSMSVNSKLSEPTRRMGTPLMIIRWEMVKNKFYSYLPIQ